MGAGQERKVSVVYCLNAENGDVIWQYSYKTSKSAEYPQSTPTIDGKYVYALSNEGVLFCFKAKNGRVRWSKDLVSAYDVSNPKYGFATSPVIEGDLIILNLNFSGIALDKKNGSVIWTSIKNHPTKHCHENDEGGYATPVLYNSKNKRYALFYNCTGLHAVDISTGKRVWYYEWIDYEVADPIKFENKIFISTYIESMLLDITKGEPTVLWKNKEMRNHFSTCGYVDGLLYGSDGYQGRLNKLRCIDVRTGNALWEKEMRVASISVADRKLIILEDDGTLRIAEATSSGYKEMSTGDVFEGENKIGKFWTAPVLCNGKIYCRNYWGDLICIDVSK
jgi:outer membrane protein assembly factor BamB